jgi:HD-GYP domain-containing protein (c-di-GMP phosphodiesterase class II)
LYLCPTVPDEMSGPSSLPRTGAIYVAIVVVIGLTVVLLSAYELAAIALRRQGDLSQWYLLAALTLLSASVTVKLPSVPATISISETFVFTSVLLYGPAAGAVIVALDGFLISIWPNRRKEIHRVAFNVAAPALSIWLSGHVYYLFPGVEPLGPEFGSDEYIPHLIAPLAIFTLTHFGINSWLITFAVAFETRRPALLLWRGDFLWLSLNYFGGASVSALLAVQMSTRTVNATYLSIIIPLLLVLYYTFKIPMDRVKDAHRHLSEVNALYVSTIETLAMAVDAKDQVTHGHIRRVQAYAVGLARALAVTDPGLIKAIEASALLHDMGKLAIPEHILNKPGKLTDAEFAKMQLHASLGADLLSSIAFPFPVIPIVRHHHENWDGRGYPTGLAGTQIPIGARILAVVDCYDALTSDRPYRPRLSHDTATSILLQRRGSMYDPLVVDTFVRVHRDLETPEAVTGPQSETYADIARLSAPDPPDITTVSKVRNAADRVVADLVSLSLSARRDACVADALDSVLSIVIRALDAHAGFIATYDADRDDLVVTACEGLPDILQGYRVALGEHLTGWVAANGRPMLNSDAALDLTTLAPTALPALKTCLSVPLIADSDRLAGVMSLYSDKQFTAGQLDMAGVFAFAIADATLGSSIHRIDPELARRRPTADSQGGYQPAASL